MPEERKVLDASILSDEAQKLKDYLLQHIIGQERAIENFVKVYQQASIGMTREGRPLAVFLFTGPTGTGKTALCQATANYLLGTRDAVTRIDCGEYQHSHETAKLIGSPPGYVGYSEKKAVRLAQEAIDQFQTEKNKINIILFDEIEEAHESLLAAILQILDAGRLTLGTGDVTDFSRSIVVLTSNLGEKEMQTTLSGNTLGLKPQTTVGESTDEGLYRAAKSAAVKYFKAKFMNRIDRLIVFRSLSEDSLRRILVNEFRRLESRVWHSTAKDWKVGDKMFSPFRPIFKYTESAKDFLIKEGTSQAYGARELNRAIDRFVAFPISALIGSKQIKHGDVIEISHDEGKKDLSFTFVEHRNLVDAPTLPSPIGASEDKDIEEPKLPPYIRPKPRLPEPSPVPPRRPANRTVEFVWYPPCHTGEDE